MPLLFLCIFLVDHFGLTTELVYALLIPASTACLPGFIWFSWVIPPAKQKNGILLAQQFKYTVSSAC